MTLPQNFLPQGLVSFVMDLQAGSSGKGKIAGALGYRGQVDVAVASFMPNAGHTWRQGDDVRMTKMLPSSGVTSDAVIVLGPDTVIDPDRLIYEIETYGCQGRVYVSDRAAVVRPRHVAAEQQALSRISSTMTGGGYCRAEKVMRHPEVELARDCPEIQRYVNITDTQQLLFSFMDQGHRILAEIAQGYDLDIDFGLEYPYCTSRHVSVPAELTRLGLPISSVGRIIGNIRPYPIRVGNTADGYSGDYAGSKELTWQEIAQRSGNDPDGFHEYTTVTKRLRRVFEFNWERFAIACRANDVSNIFLNFSNYLSADDKGISDFDSLSAETKKFIEMVEEGTQTPVTFIGTGADEDELVVNYERDVIL